VKICFEFVFNRCEKRISAFDSSLGNAVTCGNAVENKVRSATNICVGYEHVHSVGVKRVLP